MSHPELKSEQAYVDRAYEQIKLDLNHQEVGAVLVSIGASYDGSREGRTHMSPGDVALLDTLAREIVARAVQRCPQVDARAVLELLNDSTAAGAVALLFEDAA